MRRGETPREMKNLDRTVDLREDVDREVEVELKKELMRVREIVLETDRFGEVLEDKFKDLENPEVLDEYCERLGLDEGVKQDFKVALPRLREVIAKAEFSDDVLEEEADNFEQIYLALGKEARELFNEDVDGMIEQIVNGEVDLALQAVQENRGRKKLSHRGRGHGEDEASVETFENMLVNKVPEIEFDIRFSIDQRSIIHHNSTMGESAGKAEYIRDLSADELEGMKYKNGESVCTLAKLFELVQETGSKGTKINIDIKDFDEKGLDEILELIHEYDMEHRVALVSWLPQSLQYLYEKDPTLEYSLSYFPVIRGIPREIVQAIEKIPSGSRLLGFIGTQFAKFRAGSVQGVGAENIGDATFLHSDQHWTETADVDLTGRHTVPYAELPVMDEWGDMSITARFLQGGSVNVFALEPKVSAFVDKILSPFDGNPALQPMLEEIRQELVRRVCATDAFLDFANKLSTNDIKVNIFDITDDGYIDHHIKKMRDAGQDPGTVYYSGDYEGLHTRGQVPDISQ